MATSRSYFWATRLNKKEASYGVQIPDLDLIDWLEVSDPDQTKVEKQYRTNEKEINGRLGATERELESAMGQATRKMQASVEAFTAFLIWMTGRVTSSGSADPFTQTIRIPTVCVIQPPSFSYVEGLNCPGASNTFTLFKGASIEQMVLEISGKGFISLQTTIKHDGSETTKSAFVAPASTLAVKKMLGRQMSLKFGPLGTEDISDLVRSLKLTFNAGLTIPPSVTGGIYVPKYHFGEGKPSVDFEFTMAGDRSSTQYGYFKSEADLKCDLLINTGAVPARSIQMTSAIGYIPQCDLIREGTEPRLSVKYEFLHNATDDGPATFICKTGTQNYLQT